MKLYHFIFLLCLHNCTYNYEPANLPPKLVINAIMTIDSGVVLHLSKSVPAIGESLYKEMLITNGTARVIDERNGQVIPLENQRNGFYRTQQFTPQAGTAYHIEAEAPSLEKAFSDRVIMPDTVIIDSFRFTNRPDRAFNIGLTAVVLDLHFSDKKKTSTDFYLLDGVQFKQNVFKKNRLRGIYGGPTSCEMNAFNNIAFFPDKCFNGGPFSLNYFMEHDTTGFVRIDFAKISPEYFKYLATQEQPEGYQRGFADPKPHYSNIQNGYGVFVAKNSTYLIYRY
jgi:Domain of unknown function (DUF4249)